MTGTAGIPGTPGNTGTFPRTTERLLLVVFPLLVFATGLCGPFLSWDDNWLAGKNYTVRELTWKNLQRIFFEFQERHALGAEYLPLRDLSYACNWYVGGGEPFWFHLTDLVLYLIGIQLFYRILEIAGLPALWPALLFAIHPLHTECVAWISARKDQLCLVFVLLSLRLYLGFRMQGKGRPAYWASVFFALAGLLSKYTAFALPPVLVLTEVLLWRQGRVRFCWSRLAPYFALLLLLAPVIVGIGKGGVIPEEPLGDSMGTSVRSTLVIWSQYLLFWSWPTNLCSRYTVTFFHHWWDFKVAVSLLFWLGWIAWGTRRLFQGSWYGWAMLAIPAFLLPVSNLIPMANPMADRYFFLPSLGAAILCGEGLRRIFSLARLPRIGKILCGEVILLLSLLSYYWCYKWGDGLRLWGNAEKRNPLCTVTQNNWGLALMAEGRDLEACKAYLNALRLLDSEVRGLINIAVVTWKMNDPRTALTILNKMNTSSPEGVNIYLNRGNILMELNELQEAACDFMQAIEIDPHNPDTYLNLAMCQCQMDRLALTEAILRRGLYACPGSWNLHKMLGKLLLKDNRDREARKHLLRSLELFPRDPERNLLYAIVSQIPP